MTPPLSSNKQISPHVATWLGTFVAAGVQLAASSKKHSKSKANSESLISGARVGILGPMIGLSLWQVFSRLETKNKLFPIVTSSLIGSSLLKTEDEVDSVSTVIWLRVASALWALMNRKGSDVATQLAIMTTFHGVLKNPSMAPSALVKMTRKFLTPPVFESTQTADPSSINGKSTFEQVLMTFRRTFKMLLAYNYFLHLAAALVGNMVRLFASKTVKGSSVRSRANVNWTRVVIQATKEALILNSAVSASCALLVGGSKFGKNPYVGIGAMVLPYYFVDIRVRDTLYFLFVPWCMRYLFRLHDLGEVANDRVRLLLGVYMLEGPLSTMNKYGTTDEGYSWMVSVGFGLAQKLAAALFDF